MKKSGSKSYYEYSLDKHKWIKKEGITLSETERDVLILSAQGYTMNDIADKLCKSIDTIKACKRTLFSKWESRILQRHYLMQPITSYYKELFSHIRDER